MTARGLRLGVFAFGLALPLGGCNLLAGEVACNLDRDCPLDAGMPYCNTWDAGLGICVGDESYEGDFPPDDGGTTVIVLPDGGTADGGAADAG